MGGNVSGGSFLKTKESVLCEGVICNYTGGYLLYCPTCNPNVVACASPDSLHLPQLFDVNALYSLTTTEVVILLSHSDGTQAPYLQFLTYLIAPHVVDAGIARQYLHTEHII